MENAEPGSRGTGYGVPGCGKRGVWKTRGVENAGSGGKRGVWWKTRGLVESLTMTDVPSKPVCENY